MEENKKQRHITRIVLIAILVTSVLVVSLISHAAAASRTYTLDVDFDEGILVGVEHETVHDQLQLSKEVTTYPIMWIANAGEDTVSKWDTNTNTELARYHTWFGPPGSHGSWSGPAPSRTCVDLDGNCYVANRHFDGRPADVIKILSDDWIDRNGNGILDTSYDANSDGVISPSEMLPMTDTNSNGIIDDNEIQDERIAWAVSVGPAGGLGRSLAIDMNGNIWLGLHSTKVYYKLSSVDGSILAGPIDVSPNTPYGALVDRYGILWGASLGTTLLKLDTNTNTKLKVYDHGAYSYMDYGIALGYDDVGNTHVYQASGWPSLTYLEFNSATETFSNPPALKFPCLGIATDSAGNIVASVASGASWGSVSKFRPDGSVIWSAPAQVSSEARGTVVDSNDNIWIIHRDTSKLAKYRGSDGAALGVFNSGLHPYTYTDATGLSLRSSIVAFGTWTVIYDSGAADTPWGTVSWNSNEPTGTSVSVKVRSSNDQSTWSAWETATNGVALSSTPPGRYLQLETALQITSGEISPILYDLRVESAGVVELCPDEYRWGSYNWDPFPDTFVGRQEVHFVNKGTFDVYNVTATVTCVPINVVATNPNVTLGDIPAGGSAWSSDTFELRVDMTNPQGPDKGICYRVEYDDAAGVHHTIEDIAKYCGEECSAICP